MVKIVDSSYILGGNKLYFDWIMAIVGGDKWWGHDKLIMYRLFQRSFYWVIPIDENAWAAGRALRQAFLDYIYGNQNSHFDLHRLELFENFDDEKWFHELSVLHDQGIMPEDCVPDGEVTVLEVLIALAMWVEDSIMRDERFGDRTPQFFSEILGMFGLYKNCEKVGGNKVDQIAYDELIDDFLDKKYGKMTLWECVNEHFGDQFSMENEAEFL